jgi:ABC-type antimicrobial peptide transport system permease subunit
MLAKTPRHINDQPVRARVAVVLAGGLLIVTAFQAALTFGAPLGAAALGGTNSGQLPDSLRLVTGVSTVLWLLAALLVLAREATPSFPCRRLSLGWEPGCWLGSWA